VIPSPVPFRFSAAAPPFFLPLFRFLIFLSAGFDPWRLALDLYFALLRCWLLSGGGILLVPIVNPPLHFLPPPFPFVVLSMSFLTRANKIKKPSPKKDRDLRPAASPPSPDASLLSLFPPQTFYFAPVQTLLFVEFDPWPTFLVMRVTPLFDPGSCSRHLS